MRCAASGRDNRVARCCIRTGQCLLGASKTTKPAKTSVAIVRNTGVRERRGAGGTLAEGRDGSIDVRARLDALPEARSTDFTRRVIDLACEDPRFFERQFTE